MMRYVVHHCNASFNQAVHILGVPLPLLLLFLCLPFRGLLTWERYSEEEAGTGGSTGVSFLLDAAFLLSFDFLDRFSLARMGELGACDAGAGAGEDLGGDE